VGFEIATALFHSAKVEDRLQSLSDGAKVMTDTSGDDDFSFVSGARQLPALGPGDRVSIEKSPEDVVPGAKLRL
jgi:hypothetical protein